MKKIIILLFLIFFKLGYAQEIIINDSISIELLKAKKVSKNFNARSSTKVKGKNLIKILTRCKVKALYEQPVDINAFSLLDTVNKFRYRIGEYIGYKGVSIMGSGYTSKMYLKENLVNKKGKPYQNIPKYDPKITDSFEDFIFKGYTNVEFPISFGGLVKGITSPVYYSPTKMNQFFAEIYFTIVKTKETPVLELYYGTEIIAKIKIK